MTRAEINAAYQADLAGFQAEKEWLRANGYAEHPESFGRNNGCKLHPKQGKIYKERADKEFIAQFGQEAFDKHIAPVDEAGIMSIFNDKPTQYTAAWVALITAYVNENRLPKSDFDACGYRSKSGKTHCGALRYYHDEQVKTHKFVEPLSAHVTSR